MITVIFHFILLALNLSKLFFDEISFFSTTNFEPSYQSLYIYTTDENFLAGFIDIYLDLYERHFVIYFIVIGTHRVFFALSLSIFRYKLTFASFFVSFNPPMRKNSRYFYELMFLFITTALV